MKLSRLAIFAWGVLVYNILVILWGAFVRATGSGAGCGAHWPKCNGEVIPLAPSVETLIEFSHRLTTGFSGILVIALVVWAFRALPRHHPARWSAALTLAFIILEGLVGAVQVRLGLVADNPSPARGVIGSIHLINTFLLLGAMALTAWWASGNPPARLRDQGVLPWLFGLGFLGMLFLGASGAIAALGDTLFPANSLAEGLAQDVSGTAHLFVQLRVFHPIIAVIVGAYSVLLGWYVARQRPSVATRRSAMVLTSLFALQFVVGLVNVLLLAPVWMQIIHLLLADFVWIAMVFSASAALAQEPQRVRVLHAAEARG